MADSESTTQELDIENILLRHRRERRDLQAKIQALKKSTPKTDKKKRKEIMEEINRLENEFATKQKTELEVAHSLLTNDDDFDAPNAVVALAVGNNNISSDENNENATTTKTTAAAGVNSKNINNTENEQLEQPQQRITKAQKRRERKAREARQREENIRESQSKDDRRIGPKINEARLLNQKLNDRKLELCVIESDGDCLYNAIRHQLQQKKLEVINVKQLRKKTAAYIRANKDSLICYMTHPRTGESLTDDEFDKYCNAVANTHAWGGQIELKALSTILRLQIEVLQAEGPPTIQGDGEFDGPPLVITYHRYMYSLGEHYNSTQPKQPKQHNSTNPNELEYDDDNYVNNVDDYDDDGHVGQVNNQK